MVTLPLIIKSPVLWLSLKLKLVPFPLLSLTLKRLSGVKDEAGPLLFSNSPAIMSMDPIPLPRSTLAKSLFSIF